MLDCEVGTASLSERRMTPGSGDGGGGLRRAKEKAKGEVEEEAKEKCRLCFLCGLVNVGKRRAGGVQCGARSGKEDSQ